MHHAGVDVPFTSQAARKSSRVSGRDPSCARPGTEPLVPRVLWIPGIARTSAARAGLIRDRHGTAIFLDHSRLDLARLGSAEETMAVHYFHCTDGVDLVLDRTGRNVRCADDLLEN